MENIWLNIKFFIERITHPIKEIEEIPGKDPIIIAVHGIFGGWPNWGLKKYLLKSGSHSFLLDWGNQTSHFEEYVERLIKFIEKRKIKNPILIGTSAGGLVVIEAALKLGWQRVHKVITISAPYDGITSPKVLDIFPDVGEIRPDTKLIEQIENLKVPKGKLICIRGKKDDMLFENGKPGVNVKDVILPYVGHAKNQMDTPELSQDLDDILNS